MALRKARSYLKKMNKNNLMSLIALLVIFSLVIIISKVNSAYDLGASNGDSTDLPVVSETTIETSSPEELEVEPVDGTANLEGKSGKITVTEEFNTIKTAGGTIPNIKSGNLVVENGNPVSGKLFFSADSSFDLDGQHISVPKDGSIEFKDGKIIISKGTSIEVSGVDGVGGTKLTAKTDETEIKIHGDIIEATGRISVDYENSPNKIILTGKDSVLELQTEEKEKFEFKNLDEINGLIINLGSFHKSDECTGNCISYQEMGIGMSGEEWNKLKVDGNALISKYYNEEKIYEINFDGGKAKLSRDLSKLEDTEFSKKTVINYESGGITLFVETSEKRAEEINRDRINVGNGIIDAKFYDDENIQLTVSSEAMLKGLIQKQIYTKTIPEIPNQLKEKAEGVYIDDKTLYDVVKEKRGDLMTENLVLSWINQESSMNQDAKLGGCVGFTQVSAISFRDVINRNPEKYKEYVSYTDTDEKLTEAIEDDALLNLEVGFDYMNSLKTTYGFSQEKVESNYKYTGNEEDILLMAYNAGPTVTKDILTEFKNNGGGNWDKLEEFLHTNEALNIFKKYKGSYGVQNTDTEEEVNSKLERKINIVITYVKNIKKSAGYA